MGRRSLLCAVLALCVLSAACNRAGKDDPAEVGGVLRVGITAPGSLDPAKARSLEEVLIADQLFGTLTTFDPKKGVAAPGLATRWESSPDQLIWDFFLDPAAKFSDDRSLTATDVKWSFERVARRGSGSAGAELLEMVSGFPAFGRDGSVPELAGVAVVAPDHIRITLDQPLSVLPVVLSSPVLGIVPRQEAGEPDFEAAPVGSGPFALSSRGPDVISLIAAGDGVLLDGIEFHIYEDLGKAYDAFTRGEVDWSRVPPERVEDATVRFGDDGFVPYAGELVFAFNMKNPKFVDSRVREAIVKAIDRDALVRAVYGTTVEPLNAITVGGVPGFQSNACGALCDHNVGSARRLLEEARGGQPPLQVALDYDDDPTQEAVARAIQSNLQEVGITADLRPKPLGDYQNFVLSGQQEIFRLGWIAAYPSADAFLFPLFTTESSSNLTGYSVAAVDAQLRAARAEKDSDKRLELFRAAERAVMSSIPVIPLAQLMVHSVIADDVKGLEMSVMGSFDAAQVSKEG
ncbi:MAG TPA: ABC transporter substrate-binding protein [Acidimicrobiales bacterium]|nr:ABC transporter substrate-binding protein [Acidimicrobiales bacterium]